MADPRNKFTQPDDDTPFGKYLKEVTTYLNIGLQSFTGDFLYICTRRGALEDQSLGTWEDIRANNGAY